MKNFELQAILWEALQVALQKDLELKLTLDAYWEMSSFASESHVIAQYKG